MQGDARGAEGMIADGGGEPGVGAAAFDGAERAVNGHRLAGKLGASPRRGLE
jgi:hypothetical protein